MENRRQKSSSRELFSFPSTPNNQEQDSDFEFGCFTPDSPSQDPSRNSPADHLFFNGRLLPHSFPCDLQRPSSDNINVSISRAASRTSSVSSKDSLMSSRSNSTNSRSSSCSSARTSSSDNSERRLLYYSNKRNTCKATKASRIVTAQLYGSSQRWQHLTPVPAAVLMKRETSQRKNADGVALKDGLRSWSSSSLKRSASQGKENRRSSGDSAAAQGLCKRFFMAFLFACRECHAMEPSTKDGIYF
ncbi:uncharacterized protein LOC123195978 [Mangifera indica]|uniref:uncharacterized protein LOC123195978 n=1 Tax=Mangifera indica TaxID=29780 RepID=UPI001CFA5D1F|nr:uncharacterized protein LOC123195978 [Mangifera indica]